MTRPWFAICWFAAWGMFQTAAVVSIVRGTWERPEAFPAGVYESLIYADVFFIPLYFLSAVLLYRQHWLAVMAACVAGGGILYVMIYLLALSRLTGPVNVIADVLFLICTLIALSQVGLGARRASRLPG